MSRCLLLVIISLLASCAPLQGASGPLPSESADLAATAEPTASAPGASPTPAATAPAAPAPTPNAAPTASPSAIPASPTPLIAADGSLVDDPELVAGAVPAPRDRAQLAAAFQRAAPTPGAGRQGDVAVGDVEQFWVIDRANGTYRQIDAQLRYVGPVLLMYVDTAVAVEQDAIERSARVFEERIYPRNRALFGQEPSPGVDGDPRLTVLNTNLAVGGYFSADDAVSGSANRFSNQREMFVIGVNSYPAGTDSYDATLAHEFQHMIAWNQQRRRPAWLDEGMASLAEDLNGYVGHGSALAYLAAPDLQLNTWTSGLAHYGMSRLFLRYFHEQYTGDEGLAEVIALDAGNDPEQLAAIAARRRPDITSFAGLFADWAVANLLNDPAVADGRYAYGLLPVTVTPSPAEGGAEASVSQFGADYIGPLEGPLTLAFDGADSVGLVGARPASGAHAWWSNRGDESVTTLTRAIDLSGVQRATLRFRAWYEIERHFDYAYVTVSADGGATWDALDGRTTTADDPNGQSLGGGFTGVSGAPGAEIGGQRGAWVEEEVDLSAYAGRRVLLRFWLVTDPAVNGPGLLIDDIAVPEIGLADDVEVGAGGWEANGFVRTTAALAQRWELRLARFGAGGVTVEAVMVDDAGRAEVRVAAGERGVLMVAGATAHTTEPATYRYSISASGP